jgi:hypothetical protein
LSGGQVGVELEAYVEAIEGHFRTRRGAPTTLTPRDFALARGWHQAGIPLAVVLLAMDGAFEADASVSSLAYCRRRVEDLAGSAEGTSGTAPQGTERLRAEDVLEVLTLLDERLLALPLRTRAAFSQAARRLEEVRDLVAVAARPNWDYVRAKLREIDESVSGAALSALSEDEASSLRAEAARAGERHRGRVDAASLAAAVERFAVQRARERLGLPKVSV